MVAHFHGFGITGMGKEKNVINEKNNNNIIKIFQRRYIYM